jgi:hypothetical protein
LRQNAIKDKEKEIREFYQKQKEEAKLERARIRAKVPSALPKLFKLKLTFSSTILLLHLNHLMKILILLMKMMSWVVVVEMITQRIKLQVRNQLIMPI